MYIACMYIGLHGPPRSFRCVSTVEMRFLSMRAEWITESQQSAQTVENAEISVVLWQLNK